MIFGRIDMHHELKIEQCYLIHILEGKKTFEVRKNDRDFQVGDTIRFLPIQDSNYDAYRHTSTIPEFSIDYILSCFGGINQGYVCMAIKPIKK